MFADVVSAGIVFGTLIAVVVLLLCAVTAVLAVLSRDDDSRVVLWGALGVAAITIAFWLAASWPLKHNYTTGWTCEARCSALHRGSSQPGITRAPTSDSSS
jgi:uncharacterized membrane protein